MLKPAQRIFVAVKHAKQRREWLEPPIIKHSCNDITPEERRKMTVNVANLIHCLNRYLPGWWMIVKQNDTIPTHRQYCRAVLHHHLIELLIGPFDQSGICTLTSGNTDTSIRIHGTVGIGQTTDIDFAQLPMPKDRWIAFTDAILAATGIDIPDYTAQYRAEYAYHHTMNALDKAHEWQNIAKGVIKAQHSPDVLRDLLDFLIQNTDLEDDLSVVVVGGGVYLTSHHRPDRYPIRLGHTEFGVSLFVQSPDRVSAYCFLLGDTHYQQHFLAAVAAYEMLDHQRN